MFKFHHTLNVPEVDKNDALKTQWFLGGIIFIFASSNRGYSLYFHAKMVILPTLKTLFGKLTQWKIKVHHFFKPVRSDSSFIIPSPGIQFATKSSCNSIFDEVFKTISLPKTSFIRKSSSPFLLNTEP